MVVIDVDSKEDATAHEVHFALKEVIDRAVKSRELSRPWRIHVWPVQQREGE